MFFICVSVVFLIKLQQPENKGALINNEKVNQATYDEKRNLGSGGIRTHASEETGAFNQRLRPLGHATIRKPKQFLPVYITSELSQLSQLIYTKEKLNTPQDIERKT